MTTKSVTIGSVNDWMDGVIYNYPEPRYTASLYMQGAYDPDDGTPSKTVSLNMGENTIDFQGFNSSITLTVEALNGFKLTGFENLYNDAALYTLTDSLLEYEFTENELTDNYNGIRQFLITASENVIIDTTKKPFIVGNTYDSNGVRYDGEIMYSAKVIVTNAYDPDGGNTPAIHNLTLGNETVVEIKTTDTATLELTALNGFEFTGFNNIAFPENEYGLTPLEITYELSEDEINGLSETMFKYVATAKQTGGVEDPDTVTNNYLLTKERFKAFQTELFNTLTVESVNNYQTLVTDYLSAAKLYPFNIDPVNIWGTEAIKIRDYTFSALGEVLNDDFIVVNFGEIEAPKIKDNATDIVGVTCDLILPFRQGVISLDPYRVIGKKITIEGRLYISKGEITISVYDSNGINFNISNFSIGSDYLLNSRGYNESNMFSPEQALTLVDRAYLLIKTPVYDETPKVLKSGVLADHTGLIEVTEISITGNILHSEKNLIESLLKNGVILK
jgi:hypothetical protein